MGFVVTDEWLIRWATNGKSSWTAKQIKLLGLKYPAKKGWKWKVIGKEIDEQQKRRFEEIGAKGQIKLFSKSSLPLDQFPPVMELNGSGI